jgi:catechol 2,3-dioxygenase-like lactoylglutathione lyase family enzyme
MTLAVQQTIPILRIFDLPKAREFYVDFLGFAVDWEHRFEGVSPIYMQVSRAGLVLHLSEHHGDACPGSSVFVRVTGLREFHRELNEKQYGYLRPGLDETFHNSIGVDVIDPFGNRIRFDESIEANEKVKASGMPPA